MLNDNGGHVIMIIKKMKLNEITKLMEKNLQRIIIQQHEINTKYMSTQNMQNNNFII